MYTALSTLEEGWDKYVLIRKRGEMLIILGVMCMEYFTEQTSLWEIKRFLSRHGDDCLLGTWETRLLGCFQSFRIFLERMMLQKGSL